MTVYDSNNVSIILDDTHFASGGEGKIYRILSPTGLHNFCAKIYQKSVAKKKEKISYMVHNPPIKTRDSSFIICWPTGLIFDKEREFLGFIMPLAFSNSESLFHLCLPNSYRKLSPEWERKFNWNTIEGMENRAKICVNIAIGIHNLHSSKKYTIVDYKPQNIRITHDGIISILDIDSIQISHNGRVLYHAQVCTPEYAPTEADHINPSNEYISETWDRFSIAINFYEILLGIHPFSATAGAQFENQTEIRQKIQNRLFVHGSKRNYLTKVPTPHNYYTNLPHHLQQLFRAAFEEGSLTPASRPEVQDWGKAIVSALNNKQFVAKHFVLNKEPIVKTTNYTQPTPQESTVQHTSTHQPSPLQPSPANASENESKGCSIWVWIITIGVILYFLLKFMGVF